MRPAGRLLSILLASLLAGGAAAQQAFTLSAPPFLEVAPGPFEIPLLASHDCNVEGQVSFFVSAADFPETKPAPADWTLCGRSDPAATAQGVAHLDATGVEAGERLVFVRAQTGREVTPNVTVAVRVRQVVDVEVRGPDVAKAGHGEPVTLVFDVPVSSNGEVTLRAAPRVPDGWRVEPQEWTQVLAAKELPTTLALAFTVTPDVVVSDEYRVELEVEGRPREVGEPDVAGWNVGLTAVAPDFPSPDAGEDWARGIVLAALLLGAAGILLLARRVLRRRRHRSAAPDWLPPASPRAPGPDLPPSPPPPDAAPPPEPTGPSHFPDAAADAPGRPASARRSGTLPPPAPPEKASRRPRAPVEPPRADVPDAAPPQVPPPRHVNVSVAHPGGAPLPPGVALGSGRAYVVRVDVGALAAASIVANADDHPFPDHRLPEDPRGHVLDVVAVSDHFEVLDGPRRLFLPCSGPSWPCACPREEPHACGPGAAPWVEVPVRAPERPGEATLRLAVYHRNNLMQSHLVRARVLSAEGPGEGPRARVDYTLTDGFADADLFAPRDVNVLTNDNDPATHRLVFRDADGAVLSFNLSEAQMAATIAEARLALFAVHAEEYGGRFGTLPQRRNLLDRDNGKDRKSFEQDLRRLAFLGTKLFALLFEGRGAQERKAVRERLRGSGRTIQVCRTGKTTFVFPWALVYDLGLDSDPADWTLCPLVQAWDGKGPLVAPEAQRCPHEDRHGWNVLCPFGFWGYRHHLEQPPAMPHGLHPFIDTSRSAPHVAVGLSLELHKGDLETHLRELAGALPGATLREARTRQEIVAALAQDALEIAYFYCHGRRHAPDDKSEPIPALGVGQGQVITPLDLQNLAERWSDAHWAITRPLVFINGCHTLDVTPRELVSFVDSFADARAAGVIGTEVAVLQPLANEAARVFFARFLAQSAGEALLRTRIHLLAKGNLLGLAYTLYGPADLRFRKIPGGSAA